MARRMVEVSCCICGNKLSRRPERAIGKCFCRNCRADWRRSHNEKTKLLPCEICGKGVKRCNRHFNRGKHIYCSQKCTGIGRQRLGQVKSVCHHCGCTYSRVRNAMNRGKYNYCSIRCRNIRASSANYVETVFEDMIKTCNVDYLRNESSIIGLELDFYFPMLKFAVEINGVTHYKPIYGKDKLKKTKINDRKKRQLCKISGIILRTVKPGNCKIETLKSRYSPILRQIKKMIDNE